MSGISLRQGGHQVAQKFISTTLPRRSLNDHGVPDRSLSVKSIFWRCWSSTSSLAMAALYCGFVDGHADVLIAHQPRQGLGKRGARGIAQHVRNGRCHDLQRVLAGIAFGDEVSQAGDENLSVLTGRKLLNLTREPADGFDPFVI